jgi:hypothetical protein
MQRSEVQLGLRVRLDYNFAMRGVIIATEHRHGSDYIVVEWGDDNRVEPEHIRNLVVMPESDGSLEKEFENLIDSVGEQIKAHIKTAHQALLLATDLADVHGIPFFTQVSEIGQSYVPHSFRDKWLNLDPNYVADLTEIVVEELINNGGWNTSSVC